MDRTLYVAYGYLFRLTSKAVSSREWIGRGNALARSPLIQCTGQ